MNPLHDKKTRCALVAAKWYAARLYIAFSFFQNPVTLDMRSYYANLPNR